MLPYVYVPDLVLGSTPFRLFGIKLLPLTLHPFGLLVTTGVMVGTWIIGKRAQKLGYDVEKLNSLMMWVLLFAFVLSHMLDEIFYHPQEILRRPWSLLLIYEGISSFGGFVGALVGGLMWKYYYWHEDYRVLGLRLSFFKRREKPEQLLAFADLIISVFPIGWMFGRMGCSSVHDHMGARAPADSWVAVAQPFYGEEPRRIVFGPIQFLYGTEFRYDLGLLELMFTIMVAAAAAVTWRRRVPVGSYLAVICMAYAPVRFVMDFYRRQDGVGADPRYFGLTFAQHLCVGLLAMGVYFAVVTHRLKKAGIDPADGARAQLPRSLPNGEVPVASS